MNSDDLLLTIMKSIMHEHGCISPARTVQEAYDEGCSAICDEMSLDGWRAVAAKVADQLPHLIEEVPA